jgi:diguanylate cyclase (GGDEF)-like protein
MPSESDHLKQENEALKNELERLKTIFSVQQETFPDGMLIVDENDTVIRANRNFYELWAISADLAGKNFNECAHGVLMESVIVKELFTELVSYLKENPDKVRHVELLLRTGKIVDSYCAPMTGKEKKYYGRAWYFKDITDQKRVELELGDLATRDGLTEVLNRKFGILYIGRQVQLAKRDGSDFCLCYLDVNKFKTINDQFGHHEGDDVLRFIGRALRETLRKVDIVCRTGGDEFLICLPGCALEKARLVWSRVVARLDEYNKTSGKPFQISLSHGFYEFDPSKDMTLDQMISIADSEMYKDKARSR